MRLRVFKVEHAQDYVITALLLVFAIALAVSRHQSGLENFRKVSVAAVSLLEEPLSSVRVYRQALKTNRYLQRQNILLQDELSRLRSVENENQQLRNMLGFRDSVDYELLPVRIVGKDLSGKNNTFTIDAGSLKGVDVGMPLVTSDGLIGKVVLSNKRYSLVMPYYNNLFRVSARISKSRSTGIVSWNGNNLSELMMDYVPKTVPVDTGYVVETSGYGNEFPAGIPIGSVTQTIEQQGKDTQIIYLKPFTSLFDVAEGFVITYTPDTLRTDIKESYNELFR